MNNEANLISLDQEVTIADHKSHSFMFMIGDTAVMTLEKDKFTYMGEEIKDVNRFRDVRECGKHNLEPVDLICGGFPCQPHSLAGKRKGSADERDLWREFARIIGEIRPNWVLAENVQGLLSSESGRFFGRVLRDLAACGYDAEWQCLPASAFGAPHVRERVWVVAYPVGTNGKGLDLSQPLLFDSQESCRRKLARAVDAALPADDYTRMRGDHDGVSDIMDRLRCLGNAIVPQIAEYLGRLILNTDPHHDEQRDGTT